MPALEDYILAMDALEEESIAGEGLAVLVLDATASGTCGVTTTTPGLPLPLPGVTGTGDWRPLGRCSLPLPWAMAAADAWHPSWGDAALPALDGDGGASPALLVSLTLTPLYSQIRAGALGEAGWPLPVVTAGFDQALTAQGALTLPPALARAFACGLDSPVTTGATVAAVVALLGRGDPDLAAIAAGMAGQAGDDDAVAAALLSGVAGRLTYVAEDDGEDVWTCALGTYFRGNGDCEDGAILLHALLLAAGLPPDRLVTAFGRVGLDRAGHAWVGYRRHADGCWVALDWTFGPDQGPVAGLPVLGEAAFYAQVDYALTSSAFFAVRQEAAVFFARARADAVTLPAFSLAAEGSLGGRGAFAPGAGWLTCQGRLGAGAACRLSRPTLAATAGWARGMAGFPSVVAAILPGALGGARPAAPVVAGLAGGGGRAGARLPRLDMRVRGGQASTAAGVVRPRTPRVVAGGVAGTSGLGLCSWPRPRARLSGLPGGLGAGEAVLPLPVCLGCGGPPRIADTLVCLAAFGARGRGLADTSLTVPYVFDCAAGEEWR